MAHIQRRKAKKGWTYRVRYTDPDGRERSRTFARKLDAEAFLTSVSHSLLAGSYVDPAAGRQSVKQYLEEWRVQQAHHRPKTAASTKTRFETMVYPHLGDMPLSRLRPSVIRTWQKTLIEAGYAPITIKATRAQVAGAFRAAVLDRRLPSSPFDGVKAPEVHREPVVPRTVEQVLAGQAAMREHNRRYEAVIPVAAGSGLRPSELFGLTVDRIDFLARTIRVDRQLAGRDGMGPRFGPPKTKKSVRVVPVGDEVLFALTEHLRRYPAQRHELVFRTARGAPVTPVVLSKAWGPVREAMGLAPGEGLHQLRHFYASLLIDARRSIKEVQERLGHASAQETLDTYSHLFPHSDEGTRKVVDDAFKAAREARDGKRKRS